MEGSTAAQCVSSKLAFAIIENKGIISAAENGSFIPNEGWVIEGNGLTPDVIVDNLPAATYRGEDAQLTAALLKLNELLAKDPRPIPARPPYPKLAPQKTK